MENSVALKIIYYKKCEKRLCRKYEKYLKIFLWNSDNNFSDFTL